MIKVSLDEAYVFDLLSIYSVKIDNSDDLKKEQSLKNYNNLCQEIQEQIGINKFNEILNSEEYLNLKNSNKVVFDLVDRADEHELSKLTADANYDRYTKKIILQNKFFTNTLTEIKL